MIDIDKYERIFKATYHSKTYQCDTFLAHGLSLLAEVERLRYIAKNCLEAIEAGGDRETGTMMLIKENLKGMIEDVDISN